jgi:2-methylcitrate dehydratase PrpD
MTFYLDEVSAFAAECRFDDLPAPVVERTKLVIADCIGAIAGGSVEPEMSQLSSRLTAETPGGVSSVIGPGLKSEPAKAALLNGTAGTFLEMDEGNQFCKGHPGMHTFPAVFAFSEAKPASGKDLITAIAIGYEIGARVGIATNLRMSMHPHGTWGTVCAAVGVARLAGFDAGQMKTLLNVCSNMSLATSRRTMLEGGTVRNLFTGVSNQMGVLASDLVVSGFTGEHDGIGNVFGKVVSDEFNADSMTEDLGTRWEIARNYFKLHSCCRFNHAALDALEKIIQENGRPLAIENINSIEIDTYFLAAELDDKTPKNTLAGKFSVPFAIATTLVNGSSGVTSFTWDAVRNETIQMLADKIDVRDNPEMSAKLPELRPAAVKVSMNDGTVLEASTETNRGDWRDPYSSAELAEKYNDLTARTWRQAEAEAIYETTMSLDALASTLSLSRLIGQAGGRETD